MTPHISPEEMVKLRELAKSDPHALIPSKGYKSKQEEEFHEYNSTHDKLAYHPYHVSAAFFLQDAYMSLLMNIHKIRAPTMMVLGGKDLTVCNEESLAIHQGLQNEDKQLIVFEDKDHFSMFLDGDYQMIQHVTLDFVLSKI